MSDPKSDELGTEMETETPEKTSTESVKGSDEVDRLKKQLAESSVEGIRLAKEAKKLKEEKDKALEEAERTKTELENYKFSSEIPLDDNELAKKYPDWDDLADSVKESIRTTERLKVSHERTVVDLRKERQERIKAEEERRFDEKFRSVLSGYPELVGKESNFKEFCYRDENLGNTNLEVLAKSFLFDSLKEKAETKTKEVDGLETGTGGEKKAKPKNGYTPEEAKALMESSPTKYAEMVAAGKIKIIG